VGFSCKTFIFQKNLLVKSMIKHVGPWKSIQIKYLILDLVNSDFIYGLLSGNGKGGRECSGFTFLLMKSAVTHL
jgi:hypothetical protein